MKTPILALLMAIASAMVIVAACGGDDDEEATSTPAATAAPTDASPTKEPGAIATPGITFEAATATITVDGDDADWADIEGVTVPLKQIELDELDPAQVADLELDPIGELPPVDATLKVATDDENIYVLFEVPDEFDYNPDPALHNFSAAIAAMFRIDDAATAHMGVEEEDIETSLGVVDIWHWELDCAPGVMSGAGDPGSGDDPDCNLDDEYAPTPEDREDDGGGDTPNNPTGENSLSGVWKHTATEAGGEGVWIFEMSRPLQTGDTQDAQFASGANANIALAYFDPSETVEGWTDAGHLQSADKGWIEVALP